MQQLLLLALLVPGRPMHPYEMAVLLRRTGKEQDMKIKPRLFLIETDGISLEVRLHA